MLHVHTADAIATFTFGDDAIDYPTLDALREAVPAAAADDRVRLLVLDCTHATDAWSAMGEWPAHLAPRRPPGSHGPGPLPEQEAVKALRAFMKPSLALLRGDVRGVALDLACVCDLRVAAASATIGDGRIRQGRAAASGIAYLLPKLIGLSQAVRLLLLGEALAAELTSLPTRAWEVHKLQVLPQLDLPFEAAMVHSLGVRQTHVIEDRVEGMNAWRERRKPAFTGR